MCFTHNYFSYLYLLTDLLLHFQRKGEPYCHNPCYASEFGPGGFGHGGTESHKYWHVTSVEYVTTSLFYNYRYFRTVAIFSKGVWTCREILSAYYLLGKLVFTKIDQNSAYRVLRFSKQYVLPSSSFAVLSVHLTIKAWRKYSCESFRRWGCSAESLKPLPYIIYCDQLDYAALYVN